MNILHIHPAAKSDKEGRQEVLTVQMQTSRWSGLILGATIALLLGVAAGSVVLVMSLPTLEAVATATHLSKLMVQAEPPISPHDRTLLATFAGILAAAVGGAFVCWRLRGHVGMHALLPGREDGFEQVGEGDALHSADDMAGLPPPIDRILPQAEEPPVADASAPVAIPSAERPLSPGDAPPTWLPPPPSAGDMSGAGDPGFDKALFEALLTRLERGLEKHRAAVAAQAAPPPAAPAPIADIPQQPVTPTTVPVPDLHPDSPVAAREPMPPASAVPADERKADDLLDMPFPAILELLRGKMRW